MVQDSRRSVISSRYLFPGFRWRGNPQNTTDCIHTDTRRPNLGEKDAVGSYAEGEDRAAADIESGLGAQEDGAGEEAG